MDRLNIGEIERIARILAQQHDLPLEVVSASFEGGSDYVELLVNVAGCLVPPCRLAIGVFRNESPQAVYGEIAEQLRRHVDDHHRADPPVTLTAARDRRSRPRPDDAAD